MTEINTGILIKANHLKKGDVIGVVSSSSPLAGIVPHRVEKGIEMLKKMGFNVKIGKNALKITNHTAGSPEERAEDLNNFFADSSVKAIISFIGGNHSNQVLKHLDFETIKKNPKIFVGYSDITVLHFALYSKCNLITFYGPAILTQFAENPEILSYTKKYFEKAVMSKEPIGKINPSSEWTDETLDWFEKEDLKIPRKMKKNKGWKWLRKGKSKGEIIGGCISSLLHLRGTEYWPDFQGKNFFWEIPESSCDFTKGELLSEIDAHLSDLELSEVFDQIKGMLIGRPFSYSEKESLDLQKMILERTKDYNFPILYNIDIGHTDPMITIPLGVMSKIDSEKDEFLIVEEGVI